VKTAADQVQQLLTGPSLHSAAAAAAAVGTGEESAGGGAVTLPGDEMLQGGADDYA
jgi:hypothetical protein